MAGLYTCRGAGGRDVGGSVWSVVVLVVAMLTGTVVVLSLPADQQVLDGLGLLLLDLFCSGGGILAKVVVVQSGYWWWW